MKKNVFVQDSISGKWHVNVTLFKIKCDVFHVKLNVCFCIVAHWQPVAVVSNLLSWDWDAHVCWFTIRSLADSYCISNYIAKTSFPTKKSPKRTKLKKTQWTNSWAKNAKKTRDPLMERAQDSGSDGLLPRLRLVRPRFQRLRAESSAGHRVPLVPTWAFLSGTAVSGQKKGQMFDQFFLRLFHGRWGFSVSELCFVKVHHEITVFYTWYAVFTHILCYTNIYIPYGKSMVGAKMFGEAFCLRRWFTRLPWGLGTIQDHCRSKPINALQWSTDQSWSHKCIGSRYVMFWNRLFWIEVPRWRTKHYQPKPHTSSQAKNSSAQGIGNQSMASHKSKCC